MPSLSFTPATLLLSGAEINPHPTRFGFTPASLRLAGGTMTLGPNLSTDITVIAGILDNLFSSEAIVDDKGRPTRRFQQIWENTIGTIKDVLTGQGLSITTLQDLYNALNAAQQTASTALQASQTLASDKALTDSYTDPVGTLSASSSGTVTIAAHTRVYGDGTRVSVNGGSVTGFASGAFVTVYYDDAGRTGGTVAYQGTTDAVAQAGIRHVVGQVAIPAAGEVDSTGAGPTAPGYVYDPSQDPRFLNYVPAGT